MVAAARGAAAVLDHAQAPPLGPVGRGQLLQAQDPVGQAVHGPVRPRGGHVVEHQDGGAAPGKEVLDGQELAAEAQGRLRQQQDLGQAVHHHAVRPGRVEGLEDAARGLAQLQVRRVEQALLLLLVEEALGGQELDDVQAVERPAVRGGRRAQLGLRLRQREVERPLARPRAGDEELERDRGLARAGRAFEQEQPPALEPAAQHVVEARDVEGGVRRKVQARLPPRRRAVPGSPAGAAPVFPFPGRRCKPRP